MRRAKKIIHRPSASDPVGLLPIEVEMYEDFDPYKQYGDTIVLSRPVKFGAIKEAEGLLMEQVREVIPYNLKQYVRYFDKADELRRQVHVCWKYTPPASDIIESFQVNKPKTFEWRRYNSFEPKEGKADKT